MMFSFFVGANHLLFLFLLPIAFDIGGRSAGLAMSFALFSYYSLLGLTKLLWWKKQGLGWIIPQLLTISQPFLFPYFLIHSLRFTYPYQMQTTLNFYEMLLTYSAPIFTVIEGAATATTIIIIRDKFKQFLEQDEGIQIYISIISLVNYVASSYFLYSLYTTPGMDIYNATLIGSIMTLALVITISLAVNKEHTKPLWPDLSLLFMYNVYCIYMLSLDWKPNTPAQDHQLLIDKDKISLDIFQNFDVKTILDYINDLKVNINTQFITNNLFKFIERFRMITAIQKALSLNVFMSLIYRAGIVINAFYYLNVYVEKQNEENREWAGLVEEDLLSQRIFNFIISLTTPIIIAVYTHLLLCHYEYLDVGTGMWRWVSIVVCWILYIWYFNVEDD
ncbi:ICE2-domain-containing protein [Glomus cerebriforme]|uniref:ICE2-domain-containing protein n=1 Tax=Glomus cerebriforme TaxID=658196 RepID=A0A397SH30_9GLOM|nr:ICE2-domain-containing protein [Glomus cerebriforme]